MGVESFAFGRPVGDSEFRTGGYCEEFIKAPALVIVTEAYNAADGTAYRTYQGPTS